MTLNESEAETLTGLSVEEVAQALMARGIGRVIVTLSEIGVFYYDGGARGA